ncbi:DUF771 domain-containing protein [Enterococcus ureilyticus]|uniref:DUF771 domain-containing protein n=1 Tax=Enterococcus ureilyticus TaxID=1131292 RepID=UPI001A91DDC7|nr:DUF771 domain-containing protein [Enterococcus ureilyticus]MBO0445592.1 DUF771 domain-containing protein [Enterococcus ureilyticus]
MQQSVAQKFKVETVIEVPPEYVIILKTEYEELQKSNDRGRWMSLKEVVSRINRSSKWFCEQVLEQPQYRKKLDVLNDGGFVHYPRGGGDAYSFLRSEMIDFLETNFKEIMK